ncbi:MAG: hypothetical protein ACPGUU_02675 [Flavobacteriaceae bacterium]
MEFKRRFGNRKKAKPQKGLFLIVLLIIVIVLWFKAESIVNAIF